MDFIEVVFSKSKMLLNKVLGLETSSKRKKKLEKIENIICIIGDALGSFGRILKLCFIKIPLRILGISLIIAVILAPFYFFGFVSGLVVWTCIIIILSLAK